MSIIIEDYTVKSFVVYGDTKVYKDKLKELGGRYNPNLSVGPGWFFSNKKKEEIMEWKETLKQAVYIDKRKELGGRYDDEQTEIENLKKINAQLVEENERLKKENMELNDLFD
jgi:hypothetical protein